MTNGRYDIAMKKALLLALAFLTVAGVVLTGFYWFRNPERAVLDEAARRDAPGKFIRLSDGLTHYQIDGPDSGRVVLLAHGFSVPYYIWDSTAIHLSKAGYRVIRYDAYGRGWSDRPDIPYNDKLYERQIGELLDSLHIDGKLDFGGVSYGGYATGVYTGRHPDRVRSLILVDPVAGDTPARMSPIDNPIYGSYFFQTMGVPGMAAGQASDFIDASRFPDWADRYRVQMRYKGFRRALLATLRNYVTTDWSNDYACVGRATTPVLLVWGKSDRDVPFAVSNDVRAAIPGARFLPVEDSAHVPFLEHPEIVNPALIAFLRCH